MKILTCHVRLQDRETQIISLITPCKDLPFFLNILVISEPETPARSPYFHRYEL